MRRHESSPESSAAETVQTGTTGTTGTTTAASHSPKRLRALILERTRRLIALDELLRARGEPGILDRPEEDLPLLETLLLGPAPSRSGPPDIDHLSDAERRTWLRRHLRILPGGLA